MSYIYPEFAPQKAVWALWPADNGKNTDIIVEQQKAFARFIMAVSMHTPVYVAVPDDEFERARFIIPKHITLYPVAKDNIKAGALRVYSLNDSNKSKIAVPYNSLYKNVLDGFIKFQPMEFVESILPEGLVIETDGSGLFAVLESNLQCLGISYEEFCLKLSLITEIRQVFLVKDVNYTVKVASIRELIRFVAPNVMIVNNVPKSSSNKYYELLNHVYNLTVNTKNTMGTEFSLITLPIADNSDIYQDCHVLRGYLDFIISNQNIIVPLMNSELDNYVLMKLQQQMSVWGIEVNGIEAREVIKDGWSLSDFIIPVFK